MATDLIEQNDLLPLNASGFERNLNASGIYEEASKGSIMGKVLLAYPFPPNDCHDCLLKIESIKEEIKKTIEQMSQNDTVAGRYNDAYNQVLGSFQKYATLNECAVKEQQQEDQAYTNQVLNAVNGESKTGTNASSLDNWLIVGGIAAVLVVTVIIILKKSS